MIENIGVVIFDVDGTLVKSWTGSDTLLPGRRQKLNQLKAQDKRLFLATNQGGPAYRMFHERQDGAMARIIYPTMLDTISRLLLITTAAGAEKCYMALHPGPGDIADDVIPKLTMDESAIHMFHNRKINACWKLEWRKPLPGMIFEIIRETQALPSSVMMVGNSAEDRDAASAAGISYSDADEFFHGDEAK